MDWLWTNIYFPIAFWKNRFGIWLGETSKFDSLHSLPVGLHMHGPFVCQQLRICFEICFRNLIWGLIEQILSPTNLHALPTMDLHKEGLCVCQFFSQLYSETLDLQFHWKKVQGFKNSYTPYYQWAFTNMECLFAIVTFLRLNSQKPGHWEPCWEMLRVVESCWELLRVVESLTCYHWTFARFWLFVCQHLKLSK